MAKLTTGRSSPITGASGFNASVYQSGELFTYSDSTLASNVIRLFDDANNDIVFGGTGFAGDLTTGLTAGIVTSIKLRVNGQTEFTLTGLSMSAKEFYEYANANKTEPLWIVALRGNDTIVGTNFDDELLGYDGNDTILGNFGNDDIDGANGNDAINGGTGNDILRGRAGNDSIIGADGNDSIAGGEGHDNLRGDIGNDQLSGGGGNDVLNGGPGDDTLNGLAGIDTVTYQTSPSGVIVDLNITGVQTSNGGAQGDRFVFIENLTGSNNAADRLTGNKFANELKGLAGADTLKGNAGNDKLEGGTGPDSISGGAGSDTAIYSASLAGVTIDLRKTTAQIGGEASGDKLSGIENITGSKLADKLTGTIGNNVITGGNGADLIKGLGGIDTVSYAGSGNGVQVDLSMSTAQSSAGAASGDVLSGFENLTGSGHDDTLTGTGGANVLSGGGGNDHLYGLSGADTLIGGTGDDRFYYHFLAQPSDKHGNDIIKDFVAGNSSADQLVLATDAFPNTFAEFLARAKQVGADTVITFDSVNTVTLINVQKTALISDDVSFLGLI